MNAKAFILKGLYEIGCRTAGASDGIHSCM